MNVYYFGPEDWTDLTIVEAVVCGNQAQAYWAGEGYTAIVEDKPGVAAMVSEVASRKMVGNNIRVETAAEQRFGERWDKILSLRPDLCVVFTAPEYDLGEAERIKRLSDAEIPTYAVGKIG